MGLQSAGQTPSALCETAVADIALWDRVFYARVSGDSPFHETKLLRSGFIPSRGYLQQKSRVLAKSNHSGRPLGTAAHLSASSSSEKSS